MLKIVLAIVTGWAVAMIVSTLTGTGSIDQPHNLAAVAWLLGFGLWKLHRSAENAQIEADELQEELDLEDAEDAEEPVISAASPPR